MFGGGQALLPLMFYQFVARPQSHYLTAGQLLTGFGMVQAVPGPVFSVCSGVGGVALSQFGGMWQVVGCVVATVAVFLPAARSAAVFSFSRVYGENPENNSCDRHLPCTGGGYQLSYRGHYLGVGAYFV